MFTEVFNLMRVIYYGVPALIIIILLIILAVSSRKDMSTQIQKAGDHAYQEQSIQQSFEINLVGEADLDAAVGLLHCLCVSHNMCGSDLDESCQFFDPDEGRCKLRGCPGAWDVRNEV